MTIETSWYVMDNKLGVDLNKVVASVTVTNNPTQPEYPGLPHNLGDRVQGNNGSEWMFVVASVTVSCFMMVGIDRDFKAHPFGSVTATAASTVIIGWPQVQIRNSVTVGNANGGVINPGDGFWALLKANAGVRINLSSSVSASINGGNKLYFNGVTGQLSTTATIAQIVGPNILGSVAGADNGVPAALEVGFYTYPFAGVRVSVLPASLTA